MNARETQANFLERLQQATGTPVLLQADSQFLGHATIRMARPNQPAHLLLYKPEHEAVLPYLVTYQCSFALRLVESPPESRFDLVDRPNMHPDVLSLMQKHHQTGSSLTPATLGELARRFGNSLGLQLRSMPIALRIDKQIYEQHPELRPLQQQSLDLQLQENMQSLSPRATELAPPEIIRPNASMNAAFAKFFAGLWNSPIVFAPYVAAGYGDVADRLLAHFDRLGDQPQQDRELVLAWAQELGLDGWFTTRDR